MPQHPYVLPREILERYNTSGPRYTSYPTAPEWSDAFGREDALRAIAENQESRKDTPLSLYVHLPFCHKLCYYCGCNMLVTKQQDLVERYLDAVIREIDLTAKLIRHRPVVQIHWGGGTPTYLNSEQLSRLYGAIAERFTIDPEAEVSIEVHPPVTTFEQLETLAKLGFNRLSMGIQDFDPEVQQAVNRIQPFEQTQALIEKARELGFVSINTDLMYGLPFQNATRFGETLEKIHRLRPDRIALFNYAHVPWLKPHQNLIKEETLPTPEEKIALFELAIDSLLAHGYRYIGMDHFALEENELSKAQADRTLRRNFMGYTTRADSDLYSFGVSSISDLDAVYYQNPRKLMDYLTAMETDELPASRGMRLSADDRLRRDVINRLIGHCYLDKAELETLHGIEFDAYFGAELEKLQPLAEDGLLTIETDALKVTPRGQLLLRNICMAFDAYLGEQVPGTRKFSRTL
ncbi:oxygen-independent coproporphyrinogen III oxidase [bacterium]|nr:oxygen-independent coproporphyrinogen III oxidase [bacterium]